MREESIRIWLTCDASFLEENFSMKIFYILISCLLPACDCNDWSTQCRFSEELYMKTRRGGLCVDCGGNRDGQHCEKCKENHFISPTKDVYGRQPCLPCDCDPNGN